MRKLIQVELTKIRRYPAAWLVVLLTLGQSVFWAITDKYDASIASYPQVEYVVFAYSTARWFCMAAVFLTAYVIAGDFSMRTVLNVLSAGVDKRKYYVSRLAAVILFFGGLFAFSNIIYILLRILTSGEVSTVLPPAELLILLLVMSLQVLAYVAVANLISICCQKQAMSILIGEVCIFLAILLRIYAIGEDYYTGVGYQLHGPMAYEPSFVMENMTSYLVTWDSLYCFGFLKYALSASLIIAVSSMIGYIKLMRCDVQ